MGEEPYVEEGAMRRGIRLLVVALAALAVAAAQEPEPVVVKVSRFKHGIGDVFLSPESKQLIGTVYSPSSENQPGIHLCDVARDSVVKGVPIFQSVGDMTCTPDWKSAVRATYTCNDPNGGGNSYTTSINRFDPETLETGASIFKFQSGIHGTRMNLSPDGKHLAYGMLNPGVGMRNQQPGGIRIIDITAGKERLYISNNIDRVNDIAISADGKYVAAVIVEAGAISVRAWDVTSGNLLGTLEGHSGKVTALRFSPDGQWLATVAHDGAAILWNPAKRFAKVTALKKGPDQLAAATFSPDSSLLAVGGKQGLVTVWNTKTKKSAFTFHHPKPKPPAKAENQGIVSLTFDKDGKFLAAGAEDGIALIWPIAAATATGVDTKTDDK